MKKIFKYTILILIACLIPVATKYGTSYAKYAYNSIWNYYLKSKSFYFESDALKENNGKIIDNLWDGGRIYFDIKNNQNDYLVSEQDISYKIDCQIKSSSNESATCKIQDSASSYTGILSSSQKCINEKPDNVNVDEYDKATCEINGYTWTNEPAQKELYFDITDSPDEVVAEITITSTNGYKKVIKAEYNLKKDKQKTGEIKSVYQDNSSIGKLILTNSYEEPKCLRINWNSENLRYDLESNNIKSYATDTFGYINEIDIKLNAGSNNSFKFYKTSDTRSSISDFTITELESCE